MKKIFQQRIKELEVCLSNNKHARSLLIVERTLELNKRLLKQLEEE